VKGRLDPVPAEEVNLEDIQRLAEALKAAVSELFAASHRVNGIISGT
jgi:hypothetical protein